MPMSICIDHGYNKCLNKNGYRRAWYKGTGKLELLHRVVYCESNNVTLESIAGLSVRHSCDNPRCINPEHLLIGTHADNMRDRTERNRNPNVKGELNPKAQLNWDAVKDIRENYVPYKKGIRQYFADKYNVGLHVISDVISKRSWNA